MHFGGVFSMLKVIFDLITMFFTKITNFLSSNGFHSYQIMMFCCSAFYRLNRFHSNDDFPFLLLQNLYFQYSFSHFHFILHLFDIFHEILNFVQKTLIFSSQNAKSFNLLNKPLPNRLNVSH